MTQVKEWSNAALNRELTKLQGYSVKPASANPKWYRMVNPQGQEFGVAFPTEGLVWNEYAFPYCTDPAASLEVQAAAIAKDSEEYIRNMSIVQCGPDPKVREMVGVDLKGAARIANATPRERAEAAYITLQEVQHGLQTKAPNSDRRDA